MLENIGLPVIYHGRARLVTLERDVLDVLAACGMTVLISDYFEYYRLAAYLGRHTKKQIGVVMGAAAAREHLERRQGRPRPRNVRSGL